MLAGLMMARTESRNQKPLYISDGAVTWRYIQQIFRLTCTMGMCRFKKRQFSWTYYIRMNYTTNCGCLGIWRHAAVTYFKVVKVKWSRYRPRVAQRVGRGIALLFHDRGTRRGVSGQQHAPAAFYPRERAGTHFTAGWVGHRAGLDGRKISPPPGFDPGPSIP